MPSPLALLYGLLGITIVLLVLILARPSITVSIGGKILAFLAFAEFGASPNILNAPSKPAFAFRATSWGRTAGAFTSMI